MTAQKVCKALTRPMTVWRLFSCSGVSDKGSSLVVFVTPNVRSKRHGTG